MCTKIDKDIVRNGNTRRTVTEHNEKHLTFLAKRANATVSMRASAPTMGSASRILSKTYAIINSEAMVYRLKSL